MTQINIFEVEQQPPVTHSKLTPRQWRLYEFLKAHRGQDMGRKDILEQMDADYAYSEEVDEHPDRPFANLTSARMLTEDIQALKESDVIQKVFIGTRLAVDEEEAYEHLRKQKARILKELKREYYHQAKKLSLNGQKRLKFNKEKDVIESVLGGDENALGQ